MQILGLREQVNIYEKLVLITSWKALCRSWIMIHPIRQPGTRYLYITMWTTFLSLWIGLLGLV